MAAFIAGKLTVARAMSVASSPAKTNTVQLADM
jgi:hypothetical protein